MQLFKVLALSAPLLIPAIQATRAAEPEVNVDVQSLVDLACKDDIRKFCPGAERGQANACLKRNDKELSNECRMARITLDFLRKAAK